MKEEVEGLRKKLERMEKTKEELVNIELEKEVSLVQLCVTSIHLKWEFIEREFGVFLIKWN